MKVLNVGKALAVAAIIGSSLSVDAQAASLVGVDFNSSGFPPFIPASQTYSGAAVLGAPGDIWNGVAGGFSGSPAVSNLPLVDSTGTATSLTLTLPALGYFDAGTATTQPLYSGPESALLRDYVFTDNADPKTIDIFGLTASANYRLILYSSTNEAGRKTDFTVNGVTKSVSPVATSSLSAGVNYADFTSAADASGKLSFSFSGNGSEGSLNGFQIQSVNQPTAVPTPALLPGLVGLGVAAFRKRKSEASAEDGEA
ncbi:hypothetical protein C7271_09095 [filamentous cyanobacterium CCP5]|nr:hypothetical protein C7271_09095 [filamentous cyanobacterium CCP5]